MIKENLFAAEEREAQLEHLGGCAASDGAACGLQGAGGGDGPGCAATGAGARWASAVSHGTDGTRLGTSELIWTE